MAAATIGQPYTRAELADMPDDGRRYELIDGVLLVSAAPGRIHQRATLALATTLRPAAPPGFEVLPAPFAATRPFPVTVVPAELVRPPW